MLEHLSRRFRFARQRVVARLDGRMVAPPRFGMPHTQPVPCCGARRGCECARPRPGQRLTEAALALARHYARQSASRPWPMGASSPDSGSSGAIARMPRLVRQGVEFRRVARRGRRPSMREHDRPSGCMIKGSVDCLRRLPPSPQCLHGGGRCVRTGVDRSGRLVSSPET